MKKKLLVIGIVSIFLFAGAATLSATGAAVRKEQYNIQSSDIMSLLERGGTLYVGGSGPGNYTSIQDAIDDASSGDTIFVYSGTYYENIVVNKSVDIIGEDKDTTVIYGYGGGHVVNITSDGVTIIGFKIQNGFGVLGTSAIYVPTNDVIISGNILSNNHYGVRTSDSDNVDIIGNTFTGNSWRGIKITNSTNTVVSDNEITYSGNEAIWIEGNAQNTVIHNNVMEYNSGGIYVSPAVNTTISGNYIADNGAVGIYILNSPYTTLKNNDVINHYFNSIWLTRSDYMYVSGNYVTNNHVGTSIYTSGIYVDLSSDGVIEDNAFYDNYYNGIVIQFSEDFTIQGNAIINNDGHGIWLRYSSTGITITENLFENNDYGVCTESSSSNNDFHHNDFISNTLNALDPNTNTWDDGSEGNYWDDWSSNPGYPNTYHILGGNNQDNHPLIDPYGGGNLYPRIPTIDGPGSGDVGTSYDFTVASDDFEGDDVYYYIDWGDGNNSGWIGPYASGVGTIVNHSWSEGGDYEIVAKAKDGSGESNWSEPHEITITEPNLPPNKPSITGPASGKAGTEYDYDFTATDPDGNDVYYWIEWGDGNTEEWIGPYESGEVITVSHSWDEQDTYTIRAKVKDVYDAESDWATLEVEMPLNQQSSKIISEGQIQFLQRLSQRFSQAFPLIKNLLGL